MRKGSLAAVVTALVGAALVLAPFAGAKQYGYISGFNDGSIVGGKLKGSGDLTGLAGSPFGFGATSLEGIATTADGKRLFTVDSGGSNIYGFGVAGSGALSDLPGSPQPVGASPYGVAATPNGKHVFAAAIGDDLIAGFRVAGNGTLSPTAQVSVPSPDATGIAIDRKGKYLFAAGAATPGTVSAYAIGGNGSLSEVAGSPYPAGIRPYALALAPDGKTLYVADSDSPTSLHSYRVAGNGTLAELPASPVLSGGDGGFGIAVAPDGGSVYVAHYFTDDIGGFDLDASGEPTAQTGSPYPGPSPPAALTIDAAGEHLYAVSGNAPLQISALVDGVPTNPVASLFGTVGDFQSMAFTPAQPPQAKLKAKKKVKRGKKLKLNAKRSKDDGTIVEYAWRFGDGKQKVTMGPKVKHKYKRKGRYKVKVTLTDDEGCSTKLITDGRTAYCNGSKQAVATKKVKVKKK